jgi:hypothetical protein
LHQRVFHAVQQSQFRSTQAGSDDGVAPDERRNRRGNWNWHEQWRRRNRHREHPDRLDSGTGNQYPGIDTNSRNNSAWYSTAGHSVSHPGHREPNTWNRSAGPGNDSGNCSNVPDTRNHSDAFNARNYAEHAGSEQHSWDYESINHSGNDHS